jgi:transcriptional regulator with XRE-family HTH domain
MSPSVGERLKSARESRRLSLEEACGITKIQKQTLEVIEQDRVQESMDPVYARIFVKKYAAFLGLDAAAVADEYPGLARGTAVQTAVKPTLEEQAETAPRLKWLVPVGVTGVALVGIGFLGYMAVDLFHNLRQQHPLQSLVETQSEPRPKLLVPASKPLKLTIQTTADVWLQVKADGDIIFQSVLAKGSRESWTAKDDLELWTGNAGAMQLSLNGKPLEWLERGVRKGVKITRAGIQG